MGAHQNSVELHFNMLAANYIQQKEDLRLAKLQLQQTSDRVSVLEQLVQQLLSQSAGFYY